MLVIAGASCPSSSIALPSPLPAWADWFLDPGQSGGAVLDLSVHGFDVLNWVLGSPKSVYGRGREYRPGLWHDIHASIDYGDGNGFVEGSEFVPQAYPFSCGVKVVCYNFMPVFDWTRTSLEMRLPDGSTTLAFDTQEIEALDIEHGIALPGWDASYRPDELKALLAEYAALDESGLWANLAYFLRAIVPVAKEAGIKMAIHPDDPPRPIFGLPRIVKNRDDLARLLAIVDDPANGLTLCSGSLGADARNDIPSLVREFGGRGRIHFAHLRNVRTNAAGDFHETSHRSADGSLDMAEIVKAYFEVGFDGYARPDHGRMIWGETGRAGYGLYDRALGAVYLNGLWEGVQKMTEASSAKTPQK